MRRSRRASQTLEKPETLPALATPPVALEMLSRQMACIPSTDPEISADRDAAASRGEGRDVGGRGGEQQFGAFGDVVESRVGTLSPLSSGHIFPPRAV